MENDGFQSRVSQFQLQSTQLQMQNANVNSNGLRFLMALMEKKSLIRNSCPVAELRSLVENLLRILSRSRCGDLGQSTD